MNTKKIFFALFLTAVIFVPFTTSAQVTIGSAEAPQSFSVLELISNQGGLRLPQMTSTERNAMMETDEFQAEKTGKAVGLMIFNTSIRCVETWNGERWRRDSDCPCGAYIAPGEWRQFMCHNLGADTSLDPFTPHPGLHGAVFKWGTGVVAMDTREALALSNRWSISLLSDYTWEQRGGNPPDGTGDWNMGFSLRFPIPNPCPPGFRIPTADEWRGVAANNPVRNVGDWFSVHLNSFPYPYGNFSAGTYFGESLFLPATGYRRFQDGELWGRGADNWYWSSTASGTDRGYFLRILSNGSSVVFISSRNSGASVRCIAR